MSPLSPQVSSFLSLLRSLLSLQVAPGGVFSNFLWVPMASSLKFFILPHVHVSHFAFLHFVSSSYSYYSYSIFPYSVLIFPSSSLALLVFPLSPWLISLLHPHFFHTLFWSGSFEFQFRGQRKKVGIKEEYWLGGSANWDHPLIVSGQLFVIIECTVFLLPENCSALILESPFFDGS